MFQCLRLLACKMGYQISTSVILNMFYSSSIMLEDHLLVLKAEDSKGLEKGNGKGISMLLAK